MEWDLVEGTHVRGGNRAAEDRHMTRIVTALYDTIPQAELALAHLNSEVGVEEGEIVDRSVAGRTRLARMNLSADERATCAAEMEQGGYLLIGRVNRDVDPERIVRLLKEVPRDGMGRSNEDAGLPGDSMGFRVEDPKAAQTSAPSEAAAGQPKRGVGEFKGFRVEDPKAVQAPSAPPVPARAESSQRSITESEGFRVEDPKAVQAASAPPSAAAIPSLSAPTIGGSEGFWVEDPKAAQTAATATADAATEPSSRSVEVAEERIPIVHEELRIDKREVVRGGARVHSHVAEHPVYQEVELLAEHVLIERRPANRKLSAAELEQGGLLRGRVIEISEMREEAVVAKEAFVHEELVVRKSVERWTEVISDTVRRTEVEAERIPGRDG